MKRIVLLLMIAFGALQFANAQDHHINWTTDVSEAKAMAAEKNIPIFAFFTGKAWCGPCKKLTRNTLETETFANYAHENFVMLELDYPRVNPNQLDPEKMRLLQKFSVQGFPTIILMDSKEGKIGQTGYRPFTPEQYIDHINTLIKS